MSFINPFFLYFLPLLAVPTIIHLLGRQKYKKVEFSSLRFLEKLEHDVIRRLKLRQIILLILRTLLILFLILVFTRPYRTGSSLRVFVSRGETLYLVIDNSSSMSEVSRGKDLLETSIENLKDAIAEIEFPINLKIIESIHPGFIDDKGLIRSYSKLEKEISEIHTEPFLGKIDKSLITVTRDIEKSHEASVSIWIVSDFQKGSWESAKLPEHPIRRILKQEGIRIVLFPANQSGSNAAVYKVEIPKQINEKGSPSQVKAFVENWWTEEEKEIPVSLFLEGERVGQTVVMVPPHKRRDVSFDFIPMVSGPLSGVIKIGEDNLLNDNERYFVLNIPQTIRVLVVGRDVEDGRFLMRALQVENSSLIEAKFVSHGLLPMENFLNYDVMIFSNIDKVQSSAEISLQSFLDKGRGIIIFPGNKCSPEIFNSFWADDFGFPKWKGTRRSSGESYLKIGNLQLDHPIFKGLWRKDERPKSSPYFYTIPGFLTGRNHSVIMNFDDGTPLLIESNVENGKGFVLSTSPVKGWTNLQVTGLFPTLMQRMVLYLAGNALKTHEYLTGDTIRFERSGRELLNNPVVITPTGRKFTPVFSKDYREYSFIDTDEPGCYDVYSNGKKVKSFAVNIHSNENEGNFLSEEDFMAIVDIQPSRIAVFRENGYDETSRLQMSYEYSFLFLIFALIVAAAETYIGRINRTILEREVSA